MVNLQKVSPFRLPRIGRPREGYLLAVLLVGVLFFYFLPYMAKNEIVADGLNHTVAAKEIALKGRLLQHHPYRISDVQKGSLLYKPIPYPQTFHLLLSFFYMLGGKVGLKMFSPILGALVSLPLYLLLRGYGQRLAAVSAFAGVMINEYVFICFFPMMEPYLLFATLMSLWTYISWIRSGDRAHLFASGLFWGLTISIKQQGLIYFAAFGALALFHALYRWRRRSGKPRSLLIPVVILGLLATLVAAVPLYDQVLRNGTLDHVPGKSRLPFFESKYPANPATLQLRPRVGYKAWEQNLMDTSLQYVLYPLQYRDITPYPTKDLSSTQSFELRLFLLIFVAGLLYLGKKGMEFYFLSPLLVIEIVLTYLTTTQIWHYHPLGLTISAVLVVFGTVGLARFLKRMSSRKALTSLFIVAVATAHCLAYFQHAHTKAWGFSSKYSEGGQVKSYEELRHFVRENVPEDSIVMTAGSGFRYYAERNALWHDKNTPPEFLELLHSTDIERTKQILTEFEVSYIFVDKTRLSDTSYTISVYPSQGLVSLLGQSQYFEKVFTSSDGLLLLYEVIE